MKEEIISLKTAKLAKEKGFNEICKNGYYETLAHTLDCGRGGEMDFPYIEPRILERRNYDHSVLIAQAPTQSLLQRWLREVHNIIVDVVYDENSEDQFEYFLSIYKDRLDIINTEHELYDMFWDNYEEAFEEGLQEALKLI